MVIVTKPFSLLRLFTILLLLVAYRLAADLIFSTNSCCSYSFWDFNVRFKDIPIVMANMLNKPIAITNSISVNPFLFFIPSLYSFIIISKQVN